MKTRNTFALLFGLALLLSVSVAPTLAQDVERPDGWTEESHSNDVDPNYDTVFPQDAVNTININIEPDEWQAMMDNMTDLYGEFGARRNDPGERGQMPEGGQPSEGFEPPEGVEPGQPPEGFEPGQMPEDGRRPGGMGGGMFGNTEDPMWVAVDMEFEGQVWTNVGMRFKGNSSLMGSWGSGSYKMGFRLDFDQFEDDYPEIDNQRFFGFKKLSFSNGYSDDSLLREKVTADIFREAGIPSANTAFYAVYVDYGEGPVYFGLYTAVEVIDDTVIDTQFDDNDGNLYKPEGDGASFAEGTFNEETFEKKTNEDEADYSDILALFDALHDGTRTTDPETWRAGLEAVFDADEFIHWLAVNTVVQNWDTYGSMAHNYYLYNDPTTGQLTWIPWDNNMALTDGMGGGPGGNRRNDAGDMGNGGPGDMTSGALDQANVGDNWPLIRYLMDDPVYHAAYVNDVADTLEGAFDPETMTATYTELHQLIAPYAAEETEPYTLLSSQDAFDASLDELINHVNERFTAAQDYLGTEANG